MWVLPLFSVFLCTSCYLSFGTFFLFILSLFLSFSLTLTPLSFLPFSVPYSLFTAQKHLRDFANSVQISFPLTKPSSWLIEKQQLQFQLPFSNRFSGFSNLARRRLNFCGNLS